MRMPGCRSRFRRSGLRRGHGTGHGYQVLSDAAQFFAGFLVFSLRLGLLDDSSPGLEPAAAFLLEDASQDKRGLEVAHGVASENGARVQTPLTVLKAADEGVGDGLGNAGGSDCGEQCGERLPWGL